MPGGELQLLLVGKLIYCGFLLVTSENKFLPELVMCDLV